MASTDYNHSNPSGDLSSDQSCDKGQTLLSIDETLTQLLARASLIAQSTNTTTLPLNEALGRILATDLTSTIQVPPLDNSAMDGYAVNSRDLSTSHETTLEVNQRIPMLH